MVLSQKNKTITIKTPRHSLNFDCFYDLVNLDEVKTDKNLFLGMCKSGCPNFNRNYSCPPSSPDFSSCTKDHDVLFVLLFSLELGQLDGFDYKEYHKLRIGNAVLKPRIEKVMRSLAVKLCSTFLGTVLVGYVNPAN